MRKVEIKVRADSLPDALTAALRQLIDFPAQSGATSDRSLTAPIRAEAESVNELLPLLTDSLAGLLGDFGAAAMDIVIDGLRWLPDGVRVWGAVTLRQGSQLRQLDIEWIVPPTVEETGGRWSIEGRARVDHRQ